MRPKISCSTVIWVALVGCHLFVISQVQYAFSQLETRSDITTQLRTYRAQLAADGTQVTIRLKLAKLYLQIEAYTEAVGEYRQVITALECERCSQKRRESAQPRYLGGLSRLRVGVCWTRKI